MSLEYLTEQDAQEILAAADGLNLTPEERKRYLPRLAEERNYQRYQDTADKSAPSLFLKSVIVGFPEAGANLLRGVASLTPGEIPVVDPTLRAGSQALEGITPKLWQRQVGEAASGPSIGDGAIGTWASRIGAQMPVLTLLLAGRRVGMKAAGLAGAGKTGMLLADTVGSIAPLIPLESGSFNKATEGILDPDIRDKHSDIYGSLSGVTEYLQSLGMVSTYLSRFGKEIQASKQFVLPLLKFMGKEMAINTGEGLTEMTQTAIFNQVLKNAVAEQNARNAQSGKPPVSQEEVDRLSQSLGQAFVSGAGVAAIMRAPAGAVRGGRTLVARGKQQVSEEQANAAEMVRQGGIASPAQRRISLAPPGTVQAHAEGLVPATPQERLANLEKRKPATWISLADKYGIAVPEGSNDVDIRSLVLDKAGRGELVEGPVVRPLPDDPKKKGIFINPVDTNPAQQGEVSRTNQLLQSIIGFVAGLEDAVLSRVFPYVPLEMGVGTEQRKQIVLTKMIRSSLAEVIGNIKANALVKNLDLEPLKVDKKTQLLESKPLFSLREESFTPESALSRDQYLKFSDVLEGKLRTSIREYAGGKAETSLYLHDDNALSASLDVALQTSPPLTLKNGERFTKTLVGEVPVDKEGRVKRISIFRRYSPPVFALEALEKLTGLPFTRVDAGMRNSHISEMLQTKMLSDAEKSYWDKVPTELRFGEGKQRFNELLQYRRLSGEDREAFKRQLKLPIMKKGMSVEKYLIEKVREKTKLAPQDIINHATKIQAGYQDYYNWFVKAGFVAPDMFRTNYGPLILKYLTETEARPEIGIGEWMRTRKTVRDDIGKQLEAMGNGSKLDSLVDVADTIESWRRKGVVIPADVPGFMEHQRKTDREFLKRYAMESDLRVQAMIYTRTAIQRMSYGHLVPSAMALTALSNRLFASAEASGDVNAKQNRRLINGVLGDYFEMMMGVPDPATSWMMSRTIRSPFPRTSRAVLNITNNLIENYNKWPISDLLGKMETTKGDWSVNEASDFAVTWMYAFTLGLPNLTSPIKNLGQFTFPIAFFGARRWVLGSLYAMKPEVQKELADMSFRPDMYRWEERELGTRGTHEDIPRKMTALIGLTDKVTSLSAGGTALFGWHSLLDIAKKAGGFNKLSDTEISRTLWALKKPGMEETKAVQSTSKEDSKFVDAWKGIPSKPVDTSIVELIRDGKLDDAKKLYVRFAVEGTNWRYGPGGTPLALRNAAIRKMFMYTSYPMNYVDFLLFANRPGMLSRYLQFGASQLLLAGIFSTLGFKASNWMLAGSLPDQLLPIGPLASFIEDIWKLVRGTTVAATAELVPGGSEEERKKNWDQVYSMLDKQF